MDAAYKQHSNAARRKNRSSTNVNHLSLAPLTSKLPLADLDTLPDSLTAPIQHNPSYLQGKSAPATPRLLSRSPAHTRSNSPRRASQGQITPATSLPKSKSASQLYAGRGRKSGSGTVSPSLSRQRRHHGDERPRVTDRSDSDWILRAGALIGNETREFKGQSWLVSRESSTSLTGPWDADEEAYERELARERELASRQGSRQGSRRGSFTLPGMDEDLVSPGSRYGSRPHSRLGSRSQLRTPLRTPLERHPEAEYFGHGVSSEEYVPGPDFVSLDEKLEAAIHRDTREADEETIRRLVKRDAAAQSSWMGNLIGWSLFSVEENEEESDPDDLSDSELEPLPRTTSTRSLQAYSTSHDDGIPPPKADEGGWQDAAWLLSVASKVLL